MSMRIAYVNENGEHYIKVEIIRRMALVAIHAMVSGAVKNGESETRRMNGTNFL